MKKIIIAMLLCASFGYGQEKKQKSFDFSMGIATKGGFSVGMGVKNLYNNFGIYVNTRGFNEQMEYESGIDYGGIATVVVISSELKEINPYGFTGGLSYTIPKSGISLLVGAGISTRQIESETYYKYDFQYIADEYSLVKTLESSSKEMNYEFLIDYDFTHKKNYSLGFQTGYNNIHSIIAQAYFGFKF